MIALGAKDGFEITGTPYHFLNKGGVLIVSGATMMATGVISAAATTCLAVRSLDHA